MFIFHGHAQDRQRTGETAHVADGRGRHLRRQHRHRTRYAEYVKWLAVVVGLLGCGGTPAPAPGTPQPLPPRAASRATPAMHGATLRGRLLLNGVPVQEFAVALVPNITGLFDTTPHPFHAADGRFELTDAPPGTWDILIVGPGFARAFELQRELVADRVLDLGDVVLHRGPTVRGTVTDTAGTPVGNATVMVGCRRKPTGDVLTDLSFGCF